MRVLSILEGELREVLAEIRPGDRAAEEQAMGHWDAVAKPLHGLGRLENAVARMAGVAPLRREYRKAVAVFCADNGVVAQGVTQTDSAVTALVAANMLRGAASVCCMAGVAGAEVFPVDAGMATEVEGLRSIKVARGTRDLSREPAMTRQQCLSVLLAGMDMARELGERGFTLLAAGEMGIGNTTTSSAVAAVFLDQPPEVMTGRGAGLSSEGLTRKIRAIETGIAVNRPDPGDPMDVLHKVGGLDLAGLAGVFLGGAMCHVPVLVDGFISSVAALIAARICPSCKDYMLGSHASDEPASKLVLGELGLEPFLYAGMRLGEGTGAVAVMPLLDMGLAVYREMTTFEAADIEAYQPLS